MDMLISLSNKYGLRKRDFWKEKSKRYHNDEMALPTISALFGVLYEKKKQNKLATQTLEISNGIGRKDTANAPFSDYPAFRT